MTNNGWARAWRATAAALAGAGLTGALVIGCGPGISQDRRANYLAAHPEINPATRQMIQDGRVAPGMTKDQVLAAWGSPPSDCPSWRSNLMEIWDYCHHPGRTLVVFDQHGKVSRISMP